MYSLQLIDAPPAFDGPALLCSSTIMRDSDPSGKDLFSEVRPDFVAAVANRNRQFRYTRAFSDAGRQQMTFCHSHNLVDPDSISTERRFGIRVTLPPSDTLRTIIGDDWERLHWYSSAAERDRAYANMATRHGFYRDSDTPTQNLEKISR